ncbi:unnamed protein product [Lupinus luteus]|uniref:Uncharacterized protein n=1 Tax=Lupinus luteus TaxID=3873 RepID=A0AAV1WWR1_LUPLU
MVHLMADPLSQQAYLHEDRKKQVLDKLNLVTISIVLLRYKCTLLVTGICQP